MTHLLYQASTADRSPAPRSLPHEARYLGYRESEQLEPYASFFRPRMGLLPAAVSDVLAGGMAPPEYYVDVSEFADALQKPGYSPLENGWTSVDGKTYVSVLTEMPGVTAEMWDWWFGWHSRETARYKLWYPDAHQFTAVGDDRSKDRTLTDRQRYVNNVSYVDEYIGGRLHRLAIRFFEPERLGFTNQAGWTHICARVGFNDLPLVFGWLVHQVRPTSDGSEMRSRFCLNDPAILDLPSGSQLSRSGSGALRSLRRMGVARMSPRLTQRLMPRTIGPDMVLHCAREMNHLASLLPDLHAAFREVP